MLAPSQIIGWGGGGWSPPSSYAWGGGKGYVGPLSNYWVGGGGAGPPLLPTPMLVHIIFLVSAPIGNKLWEKLSGNKTLRMDGQQHFQTGMGQKKTNNNTSDDPK